MGDIEMSDESNDLVTNQLDIEEIERLREEEKLKKKLRQKEEKRLADESNDLVTNQLDIEEIKRLREEEKLKKKLRQKEEKRLADEETAKKRKEQALKGMKYLLTVSQKYSDFFKKTLANETKNRPKPLMNRNKLQPTMNDMQDAVTIENEASIPEVYADITKHLTYFEGGTLKPYQVEGVSWMSVLFNNCINGILADEMGLGKTVQVIALICHLLEKNISGPFLIIAPLSTIPNWESEFKRFAPKVPVVIFHGSKYERPVLFRKMKMKYPIGNIHTYPVVITSYQVPLLEQRVLDYFRWQYVIVDEGHRIKNHKSQLAQVLRSLTSANRLLLTGTPLHNNIAELWALLNFLMPQIFNNMDTFASLLMLEDVQNKELLLEEEEKTKFISTLHNVLSPFVLRRLKKDVLKNMVPKKEVHVYCPISKLQKDLYKYVLEKNIEKLLIQNSDEENDIYADYAESSRPRKRRKCAVNHQFAGYKEDEDDEDDESFLFCYEEKREEVKDTRFSKGNKGFIVRLTMSNPIIMFKKIVDHPYLVHFPLDPNSETKELLINEDLIKSSGKLMVLDAMLPKLKKGGHKVLIFSTLVMTLDFIEEFMIMRGHKYCRLDGTSKTLEYRSESISQFNNNPDILAFLISTRAGGLGLNLIGADTVIFFDRDWNPQADIQAQDRCHRIGQTKPVVVYTLVTRNTIDEVVIKRGQSKRLLEKLVIKDGKFVKSDKNSERNDTKNFLQELLKDLQKENDSFEGYGLSNDELDKLLDRSDMLRAMAEDKEN